MTQDSMETYIVDMLKHIESIVQLQTQHCCELKNLNIDMDRGKLDLHELDTRMASLAGMALDLRSGLIDIKTQIKSIKRSLFVLSTFFAVSAALIILGDRELIMQALATIREVF